MGMAKKTAFAIGALLVCGIANTASAAFTLFDNFDAYPAGPLNGQGPAGNTWTAAAAGATVGSHAGSGNAAVLLNAIPNYRSLNGPGLAIPNTSTAATVYFQFNTPSNATSGTTFNNFNFVVTDNAAPPDTAGSSQVQFNWDSNSGAPRIRNGANFRNISIDGTSAFVPNASTDYSVWFVINNSADTYQTYMQSAADARVSTPTLLTLLTDNTTTATFRNAPNANALQTINFGNGSTAVTMLFDNIYVDTSGSNLTNPIPEPASLSFVGLGGLVLLRRRRR